MKSIQILIVLFFFSFSMFAQTNHTPKNTPAETKKENKYIDLEELKAMRAKGVSEEVILKRYNEMIQAIDHDFHGVPAVRKTSETITTGTVNNTPDAKEIKPAIR